MDVPSEYKDQALDHVLQLVDGARSTGVTRITFNVAEVCEALGFESDRQKEAAYLVLEGHHGFPQKARVEWLGRMHRSRYEEIFEYRVAP